MDPFIHLVRSLKNMLVITTGAVIGFKIVSGIYDFQMIIYFVLGVFGYFAFSLWEEEIEQ